MNSDIKIEYPQVRSHVLQALANRYPDYNVTGMLDPNIPARNSRQILVEVIPNDKPADRRLFTLIHIVVYAPTLAEAEQLASVIVRDSSDRDFKDNRAFDRVELLSTVSQLESPPDEPIKAFELTFRVRSWGYAAK